MSQVTELATASLNGQDTTTVELIEAEERPAVVARARATGAAI